MDSCRCAPLFLVSWRRCTGRESRSPGFEGRLWRRWRLRVSDVRPQGIEAPFLAILMDKLETRGAVSGRRPLSDDLPERERAIDSFCDNHRLTVRECEVIRLICRGMKNAAIAETLGVSVPTVRLHIGNIHRKIGTGDKTELVLAVWIWSLGEPDGLRSRPCDSPASAHRKEAEEDAARPPRAHPPLGPDVVPVSLRPPRGADTAAGSAATQATDARCSSSS